MNPASTACTKSVEAYTKQTGIYDYGSKFNNWANDSFGKLTTTAVATVASYERFHKISLVIGSKTRYNLTISADGQGSAGVTWRIP